jgi:protein TonB
MLWLSAALHAAVIGLTSLPPPKGAAMPPELEVRLVQPAQPAPAAAPMPEPKPVAKPSRPVRAPTAQSPSSMPVQPLPQTVAPAAVPLPAAPPPPAVSAPVPAPSAAANRESPGAQVNIPLVADSRYYSARELDVQPSALRRPEPVYPSRADEQGVSGRVVIRLHLEIDGSVSKTEVVSVSPGGVFGELFRKSTLDSVKGIQFRPAQRNGQMVRAVVEIPVVFEPDR